MFMGKSDWTNERWKIMVEIWCVHKFTLVKWWRVCWWSVIHQPVQINVTFSIRLDGLNILVRFNFFFLSRIFFLRIDSQTSPHHTHINCVRSKTHSYLMSLSCSITFDFNAIQLYRNAIRAILLYCLHCNETSIVFRLQIDVWHFAIINITYVENSLLKLMIANEIQRNRDRMTVTIIHDILELLPPKKKKKEKNGETHLIRPFLIWNGRCAVFFLHQFFFSFSMRTY